MAMKGIIYKYTSPSGKVYIGQTLNEEQRRKDFLGNTYKYAGEAINNARMKYGPKNFQYEILYEQEFETKKEAVQKLNELEQRYIIDYNSIENGYNISKGGDSVNGIMDNDDAKQRMIQGLKKYYSTHTNPFKGHKHTEAVKAILREKALGRPSAFKGKKHSDATKKKLSDLASLRIRDANAFYKKHHSDEVKKQIGRKNSKQVAQIDIHTLEILNVFDSARQAALYLGKPNRYDSISNVCLGKIKIQNGHVKHSLTACGYKWKFWKDIERSTTIEKDGKIFYCPE